MTEIKDPFPPKGTIEDELDALAKKIPALPSDFGELRRLLALLPSPLAAETQRSDMGNPATSSVGQSGSSQSSSPLLGPAAGSMPLSVLAPQVTSVGWAERAVMEGFDPTGVYTTAAALAAAGGTLLVPVSIHSPMRLSSVSIWNTDSTLARAWNWEVWGQASNSPSSNALVRYAKSIPSDSFTAAAASKRTLGMTEITVTSKSVPMRDAAETFLSPDNTTLYGIATGGGYPAGVWALNLADGTSRSCVLQNPGPDTGYSVGACDHGAMSPDGAYIYALKTYGSDTWLVAVRTSDMTEVKSRTGPALNGFGAMSASADGTKVYAAYGSSLEVINVSDWTSTIVVSAGTSNPRQVLSTSTHIYVLDEYPAALKVIRRSDHTVVASLSVGPTPTYMTITPSEAYIYVSCGYSNNVTVIRTSDNTVYTTVAIGSYSQANDVSPDGAYIYVGTNGLGVKVIRVSDNTVVSTFGVAGQMVNALKVSPDNLYVYAFRTGFLDVYRISDGMTVCVYPMKIAAAEMRALSISSNSAYVYWGAATRATVEIYALSFSGLLNPGLYWFAIKNRHATNTLGIGSAATGTMVSNRAQTKTLPDVAVQVGTAATSPSTLPAKSLILPAQTYLYAQCGETKTLAVIRLSDFTYYASTLSLVSYLDSMAVLPSGAYIYVTTSASGVKVVRTSDNTVYATVTVGTDPRALCALPNGNYVYVCNYGSHNISVIRTSDNTVVATIENVVRPMEILPTPDSAYVYVMLYSNGGIAVIRTSDNTVITTIPLTYQPHVANISPDGAYLYLVTYTGNFQNMEALKVRVSDNTIVLRNVVGTAPSYRGTISNDGTMMYAVEGGNGVTAIRTSNLSVFKTVDCPVQDDLAVSPDGKYVIATAGGVLTIIRASDMAVVATLYGNNFSSMTFSTDSTYLYVTDQNDNSVKKILLGDPSILDATAATWTKQTSMYAIQANGIVFGQTDPF